MSAGSPALHPDGILPSERALADEWLRNGGNGTQAALATRDISNPNTAGAVASSVLRRSRVQRYLHLVLAKHNVNEDTIGQRLGLALSAKRVNIGENGKVQQTTAEDWQTQLRAVEISSRLLKLGGYGDKPATTKSAGSRQPAAAGEPQPVIDFILASGRLPTDAERARLLNPITMAPTSGGSAMPIEGKKD